MDNKFLAHSEDYSKLKLTPQITKRIPLFSSLIFFSGMLFLSPYKVVAATLDKPITVSCMGQDVGNITINFDDDSTTPYTGIEAKFTHTLANFNAAANQCWGGHFNWLNIVRDGTNVDQNPRNPFIFQDKNVEEHAMYPWVDPLSGGNLGFTYVPPAPDDTLPFYWGEKPPTATEVTDNIMGNMFKFSDKPNLARPNFPEGRMWNFETYLVSVPGAIGQMDNMTFHLLTGFKWKFTQGATRNNNTIMNVMPIATDANDINNILKKKVMFMNMEFNQNFPEWTAIDIKNHPIPEPSSVFGLLLLGTLGAGSAFKQKLKQHKSAENTEI